MAIEENPARVTDGYNLLGAAALLGIRADEIDALVGKRIRQRRRELGMTPAGLASELRIPERQLTQYEKAQSRIGASRLLEIARLLKVSIAYFYAERDADLIPIAAPLSGPALKVAQMIDRIKDEKTRRSFVSAVTSLIATLERK